MKKRQSGTDIPGEGDFYYDELGRMVFTEAYHLKRGHCCKSGCRHCPYGFRRDQAGERDEKKPESGD